MPPEGGEPGPHPEPGANLPRRKPLVRSVAGPWFRIHTAGRPPLHFGRDRRHRFDAPAAEFGVLYVGADESAAFVETFARSPGPSLVTWAALRARRLSRIEARRPLRLIDLTGAGLARIGADERLCAGDWAVAQRWSRALWGHPRKPDGILYRSRHDPSRQCAAIFDRARGVLRAQVLGSPADPARRDVLVRLLDTYGFGLVE